MGFAGRDGLELAEAVLQAGEHHLLLVQRPQTVPTPRADLVTTGEPGKDDVLFAARLVRHVGAQATLMSVLDHGLPIRPCRSELSGFWPEACGPWKSSAFQLKQSCASAPSPRLLLRNLPRAGTICSP